MSAQQASDTRPADTPIAMLVCPVTKSPLRQEGEFLVSPEGRRYAIREGIPVLLPESGEHGDGAIPTDGK